MRDVTPGFNHPIPTSVMTPDAVDTRIGRLEFFDGFPTADNVAMGVTAPDQVMIMDELMDSNPLFLTGNTDTVCVGPVGLEPTTRGLKVRCSAN